MPIEPYDHETWKNSRDRRLHALSELASSGAESVDSGSGGSPEQHDASFADAISPLTKHRKVVMASRWRMFAIATLVVIVIVGSIVAVVSRTQGVKDANSQMALHARSISVRDLLGLHCISQPIWSPDGKYIALLGTAQTGDCVPYLSLSSDVNASSGSTPPQTLAIIDAATGHVVHSIALDPLLDNRPNCNTAGQCGPDTARLDEFYGLSWSPDGRSIAIAYVNFFSTTLDSHPVCTLLVVRADGSAHFRIADNTTPVLDSMHPDLRIWDLQSQSVKTRNTFDLLPFSLPFANAYLWSGGDLTAALSTVSPNGIGSPEGQTQFSPWQSGSVDDASAYTKQNGLVTYQTSFWAWAPDGSYVATFVQVGAQMQAPGLAQPTVDTRQAPGHILSTPVRDAALANVVRDVAEGRGIASRYYVSWRPDGTYLAALSCSSSTAAQLALLSTADGHTRATAALGFPLSTSSSGCTQDLMPITWSPNGSTIMTSDAALGTITLWQVPPMK